MSQLQQNIYFSKGYEAAILGKTVPMTLRGEKLKFFMEGWDFGKRVA